MSQNVDSQRPLDPAGSALATDSSAEMTACISLGTLHGVLMENSTSSRMRSLLVTAALERLRIKAVVLFPS
nr:hypothetical protein CFP56_24431 [Quercus suber]